jgi:hypothetical protein
MKAKLILACAVGIFVWFGWIIVTHSFLVLPLSDLFGLAAFGFVILFVLFLKVRA